MNAIYVGSTPIVGQGGGNSFDINNYLVNPVKYESVKAINTARIGLSGKCIFVDVAYYTDSSSSGSYMRYTGYIPYVYGATIDINDVPILTPLIISGASSAGNYKLEVIRYNSNAVTRSEEISDSYYYGSFWVGDAPKLYGN